MLAGDAVIYNAMLMDPNPAICPRNKKSVAVFAELLL